eukprot:804256-Rhodomonas_salina.2
MPNTDTRPGDYADEDEEAPADEHISDPFNPGTASLNTRSVQCQKLTSRMWRCQGGNAQAHFRTSAAVTALGG